MASTVPLELTLYGVVTCTEHSLGKIVSLAWYTERVPGVMVVINGVTFSAANDGGAAQLLKVIGPAVVLMLELLVDTIVTLTR